MAFSKIILNGTTQIDLTQDTVVADKLYQSYTAHGADGEPITGTASGGGTIEDKFITVTFNNHLETGGITLYYVTGANLVNSSSGYVEMVSTTVIQHGSSTTKLMPYGFGLAVRTSSLGGANAQNFDVQMNNTVIDPHIEGKYSTAYYKYYKISKTDLDSSNNVIDFYSTSEPFKDTVVTDTLSVTVNDTYTATLGTAYSEVTVNVPQETFVVTLSWDDDYFGQGEGAWIPDKTYSEIQTAYTAGKTIVVVSDTGYNNGNVQTCGGFNEDDGNYYFDYYVVTYNYDSTTGVVSQTGFFANMDSSGNITCGAGPYYYTEEATALNSEVASGSTFFANGGLHTGTAPRRDGGDLYIYTDGRTVIVPAGFYEYETYRGIPYGSATTPATTVTANPSISVNASGLITATASASQSVTPTVSAGYVSSGTSGTITVSGSNTSQLSTQAAATITPTESEQTAVAAGKYTTGVVKVGAISPSYVGSEITRRSSSDLSSSGATVTAPAGYYESDATKTVASGTEGTPTATKGTVSNHSVSVTPSVTNTAGYIAGGTKTGTAVSVSASELVSGTKSITANGTGIDVVGYASVDVSVSTPSPTLQSKTATPTESVQTITPDTGYDGLSSVEVGAISSTYVGSGITRRTSQDIDAGQVAGEYRVSVPSGYYQSSATVYVPGGSVTALATKGTVSNHSISITPSATRTAGYVQSGSVNGTAVSVSASELVSGSETKNANGTYDVTNLASLVVAIPFSTITVSSSNPTGGSNGDVWIKTA